MKPVRLHTSLHCTLVYIAHFLTHQLKQKAVFAPLYIAHLSTLHTLPCTEGVQFTQVSLYLYGISSSWYGYMSVRWALKAYPKKCIAKGSTAVKKDKESESVWNEREFVAEVG